MYINAVNIWPLAENDLFNIKHVSLREHYARTTKQWTQRQRIKTVSIERKLGARHGCRCDWKPERWCTLASVLKDELRVEQEDITPGVYFRLLLVSVVWNTLEADMRFSMYWPRTWFSDFSFRFSSFTASTRAERSLKERRKGDQIH